MQINDLSKAAAAAASVTKPAATGKAAGGAKVSQSAQGDRVTLSDAAKQISVSNAPNAQDIVKQAETSINSGNYSVVGTALGGRLVVILVE